MRREYSTGCATLWRIALVMALASVSAVAARAQSSPVGRPGASAVQASGKEIKEAIAVLDLVGVGTSNVETQALTERLREELLKTGRYKVVDRALMDAALNEQQFQQAGCTSAECAVQVGKMLGVRKLVSGKIIKLGESQWLLTATMVDVETTETERAESLQYEGRYFALLSQGIVTLVGRLSTAAPGKPGTAAPAAVQTAQDKPRPSSRIGRPRIAVFPYLVSGGGDYRAKQVAQECLAQLKGRESIEIAYSFYPDATAGASLAADKAVAKSSWSGLVSASPNTDLLKIRAQELGLDFIVQLQLAVDQYGAAAMANYSFRTYLYDAKNNLVSSGANTKLGQNCAGERDASAVLKSVTDLIEASAAGDAYAIAPAAVQPAQARPRPSSRNARPRIAVFPYLVSGGGDYRAEQVAQQCLAQLKGLESVEIGYSFYPDVTAGASLAADKAVAKSSWSGLVSASPNTDLLKIRAQELGLDFIVQLQLAVDQYGPAAMANYSFRTYLYDSKNNLVSSGASTKLGQNCAGERNASAVRASVTDLIDAAY